MLHGKNVIKVWRGSQNLAVVEDMAQGLPCYAGYVNGQRLLVAQSREAAMRGLLRSKAYSTLSKGTREKLLSSCEMKTVQWSRC